MAIEDYALIGDTRAAGLVSKTGSLDWLRLPRFDSGACFASLLGEPRHGRWSIHPVDGSVRATRRRYREDTLVLETEFATDTGIVRDAVRRISEKTARSEAEARETLVSFNPQQRLVRPDEVAIIERTETDARVHECSSNATANHWQAPGWHGHSRGYDSTGRVRRMLDVSPVFDPRFPWLAPPILNGDTRLVVIADAREGRIMARGFEATRPATEPFDLAA